MNWMQWYEVIACIALACSCLAFNIAMHSLPRVARICTALLGLSALIRGASLFAKFEGIANLSRDTITAANNNIPILTAIVLASIVWQQIRNRTKYEA